MNNPATANLICKRPDYQFFTDASSVSTAAYSSTGSSPGIGAYGVAENPCIADYSEVHASGVIIRPPKEEGTQRQATCLWRKTAVPAGLISLGVAAFLALEADEPDLGPNGTTASWERSQEPLQIHPRLKTGFLSLDQAGALALRVFSKAEEELQAEREAEARFLAGLWQDELL